MRFGEAFVLACRRLWTMPWTTEELRMTHKTDLTSFPGVLRTVSTDHLVRTFAEGPARIRRAVNELTDDQWTARPIDGKWSIAEIVLHLADAEIMGAARIRQAVAEPGAVAAVYDQDTWAMALGYAEAPREAVDEALDLFALLRRTTLSHFGVSGWDRTVAHAGWGGPITLRQLLELYADHSERHLAQILERRTLLGTPIEMDLLLPDRLY